MYYYLLLIFKLLVFILSTKVSYSPWLVFSVDMVVVSALSFLFFKKERWAQITSLIVYTIISLILTVDTAYFSYFNRLPAIRELSHAQNVGDVTDALSLVLRPVLLLYVFDLPFLFVKVFRISWKGIKNGFRNAVLWVKTQWTYLIANVKLFTRKFQFIKIDGKSRFTLPMVSLAIFLILILIGAPFMDGVKNQSLFLYHGIDIAKTEAPDAVTDEDITDIIPEEKNSENEYTGIAKGKNLIVIQVESLNNFVINRKYGDQEVTPNLNALVNGSDSIYASDYYEMLGAGNTSDAEFVTMHSMYPSMKNPSYEVYIDKYLHGLPKIMKENGYNPIALHGYRRDFWIRDRAYPHIGFEKFYAADNYKEDEMIGMGLGDKSFFKQSVPMLESEQSPFYAFMVTLTSHVPYEMPAETQKINLEDRDKGTLFGNYLQAVHYTDEAIGQFVQDLKDKGLYENSVIAIYGDHHGFTGFDKEVNDRIQEFTGLDFDYDTLLNIPLIINIPNSGINKKIDGVRSQLDFAPTVLNLLGIDYNKYIFMGQDILSENHYATLYPQAYMTKGSFINDDYIFKIKRDGIFENGVLKNRKTREEEDIAKVRPIYEEGIKRINLSKSILEHDLIKSLMAGETLDSVKDDELRLDPAVEVKDSDQLRQAYEAGFNTFRVRMNMTTDGYFVTGDSKGKTISEMTGDFITLGDLVTKYKELNFIVSTPNSQELAKQVRLIPGLQTNLIIDTQTIADYAGVSNKQNGFRIMFSNSKLPPNEMISMSELNSELIFYGNPYQELQSKTYKSYNKDFPHQNTIYIFSEIDLTKKRDFKFDDAERTLEFVGKKGKWTVEELLAVEDDDPRLIDFKYSVLSGEAWADGIQKQDGEFSLTELKELMDQNPKLRIAIGTDSNQFSTVRSIAASKLPLNRMVPFTNHEWFITQLNLLGFPDYAFIGEENWRTEEIRKLNKACAIKWK